MEDTTMNVEAKRTSLILLTLATLVFASSCKPPQEGAGDWFVADMATIKTYGKSVDWLHQENLIATARPLYDHYYDVVIFSMDDPDSEVWLTHQAPGAPQKHNGNPSWHPLSEYIVFTAENEDVAAGYDAFSKPGRGVNCNLWLARADGSAFWQLTDIDTAYVNAGGVIHPQFSPDGNLLFWAERIADDPDTYWGHWAVKVAEFVDDGKTPPHLENIQSHDPSESPGFYESHAFSHDGLSVLLAGNLLAGQHEVGMDICEMDLQTKNLARLTTSLADWDEHAHWSPDGEHIVWMSSTGLDVQWPQGMGPLDWRYYLETELWIMDADGSNKKRLTFYNEPGHAHNKAARTVVSDSTWAPDGNSLLVLVAHYDGTGPASTGSAELVLITLGRN
jgi:Tol biopolymer transport system component